MMVVNLIKYWFEFEHETLLETPIGLCYGCGITAYNYDDALQLLKEIFKNRDIAPIKTVIKDVDVSTLEPNHVLPNVSIPTHVRGIWYPSGYNTYFTAH